MVDGYFASRSRREPPAAGQLHGPPADGRPVRPLGDLSAGSSSGTGNKTESLIGYTTLFGDSACAFNPIGDLYKSQVRQVAAAIGVPDAIISQGAVGRPVARPDRRGGGRVQLPVLDRLLFWMIDRRRTDEELVGLGFDPALIERVGRMVATSEFKRQVPPIAKLGPRTAGVDYLYPRRRPGSARR